MCDEEGTATHSEGSDEHATGKVCLEKPRRWLKSVPAQVAQRSRRRSGKKKSTWLAHIIRRCDLCVLATVLFYSCALPRFLKPRTRERRSSHRTYRTVVASPTAFAPRLHVCCSPRCVSVLSVLTACCFALAASSAARRSPRTAADCIPSRSAAPPHAHQSSRTPCPSSAMAASPPPRAEHKSAERRDSSDEHDSDMADTIGAASVAGDAAAAAAAAASAASPVSSSPPPVQSRVGRRVQKPQHFDPAAGASARSASPATNGSVSRIKATKRGGGKQPPKKSKSNTEVEEGAGYHGQGYTVTDHSWWGGSVAIYASPVLEDLDTKYTKINCEEACAQAGIELVRSLRVELEPDTVEALKQSIGGPQERGEKNRAVLNLCDSGETVKCALFQSEPGNSDSIRVVSTCFIKSGEPLGMYMGTLRELRSFEKMYGSRPEQNASSYEIAPSNLPDSYTGPSLILETTTHGNEGRFIRDARWDDLEISPNVQCRVCWNHAKGLPYLALVALADIEEGCELFVEWGLEAWSAHARARLHKYSSLSWERHQRMKEVQRALAQRGVEPYASREIVPITAGIPFEDWHCATGTGQPHAAAATAVAASASSSAAAAASSLRAPSCILLDDSSAEPSSGAAGAASGAVSIECDEVRYMGMASSASSAAAAAPTAADAAAAVAAATLAASRLPQKRGAPTSRKMPAPSARGHTPTFILRNTRQVFENCGRKQLMPACDYSELSAQTLADLKAVGGPPRLSRPQNEALAEILRTGRCPKAAVYEVVSLRHPARFYCSPDYPAYALLARQRIDAGEPIGVYIGKMWTHDKFHGDSKPEDKIKQVYAYDLSSELFPKQYRGEALVCESLSIGGNETRYVNDVWCRRGGGGARNAEASLMFHFDARLQQHVPVMVICASRTIHKGDEIITDYGTGFWNKISTALVREHEIFMQKSQTQLQETEKILREEIRKEKAMTMGVDPESIPLDSIELTFGAAPAAASSSSSAAAAAASPAAAAASRSSKWDSYRSLFNQHDVLYSHCSPPVLLDADRHADPFAAEQFAKAAAVQEAAIARERERQERAAKHAERVALRKAQAEVELEKKRQLRQTAPADERKPRQSARNQKKADDDGTMMLDSDAQREEECAGEDDIGVVNSKLARAAARSPTKRSHSPVASSAAAAASSSSSSAAAAASSAPTLLSDDDDDVQFLSSSSSPPAPRASPPARAPRSKKYVSLSRSSLAPPFQCDECGSPCHARDHGDTCYIKCREHYKIAVRGGRQAAGGGKSTTKNAAPAAAAAAHGVSHLHASVAAPPAGAAAAASSPSSSVLHKRKSPSADDVEHKSQCNGAAAAAVPDSSAFSEDGECSPVVSGPSLSPAASSVHSASLSEAASSKRARSHHHGESAHGTAARQ